MRKITRARMMIVLSEEMLDAAVKIPFDPAAYHDVLRRMRHTISVRNRKKGSNFLWLVIYFIALGLVVGWTISVLVNPDKFGGP